MIMIIELVSGIFLAIGCFLIISGGIGILRFPDFYTRMHAVSVTDTLAAAMILMGLMLQSQEMMVIVKLMMILLLLLFITPAASHTLAKAAMHNGLMPKLDKKQDAEKEI